MSIPSSRALPRVVEVKDLFTLGPCVLPLEGAAAADHFDPTSGLFAYRFFRDAEATSFVTAGERFQPFDAWVLSDAAFLAYVDSHVSPCSAVDSERAAAVVEARIKPSLVRLFEAMPHRQGLANQGDVTVHTMVRGCPIAGIWDPIQCYVADDGQFGIVAFRGTLPASVANWLTDLDAELAPADALSEHVRVHEGFWRAAKGLLDDFGHLPGLRRYLSDRWEKAPELKLWFTGHSLGAALATLSAYEIRRVHSLYTYGSPRVGNESFAEAFSKTGIRHYRVVHRHDVVPHLPVSSPIFGYSHVGELKYIADPALPVASTASPTVVAEEDEARVATPAPTVGEAASPHRSRFEQRFGRVWARLREQAGHLHIGGLETCFEGITDHAPIYYSTLLWNEFVNQDNRDGVRRDLPVLAADVPSV